MTLHNLPTAEDGAAGLETLIEAFGIDNVQAFLRYIRDDKNTTTADWMAAVAWRQIDALMASNPALTEHQARLKIRDRWGYKGTNASNFNRMLRQAADRNNGRQVTPG